MALGKVPLGAIVSQEDLYIEGAPNIYIQDAAAPIANTPDLDGYYYGSSASAEYPVYLLGCISDVSFTEGVTMNDVKCDTVGIKDTIQRRDYVEMSLTISSLLPFSVSSKLMNLSTATVSAGQELVGIGSINNSQRWHVFMPRVYDSAADDFVFIWLHKAKFIDAWTINMASAEEWKLTGLKLRAYADESKPSAQLFGVFARSDVSAIP